MNNRDGNHFRRVYLQYFFNDFGEQTNSSYIAMQWLDRCCITRARLKDTSGNVFDSEQIINILITPPDVTIICKFEEYKLLKKKITERVINDPRFVIEDGGKEVITAAISDACKAISEGKKVRIRFKESDNCIVSTAYLEKIDLAGGFAKSVKGITYHLKW